MDERLQSLIDDVRDRVHAKDPTAVERARQLADQYPDEPQVWSSLAYALARNKDLDGAVLAMTRMIEVAPMEMGPSVFWERGMYEYDRGTLEAALADLSQGIALSKQHRIEDYLEWLYFWRRTKADIMADCEE